MATGSPLLETLGGEAGCKRLSTAFYARVAKDPILRPLFPGKSQKCAIEEFAAFLIQFLGGDEAQTQRRWWLSLRESHARFNIDVSQREAWLKHMTATLDEAPLNEPTRSALKEFFGHSSGYVMGHETPQPEQAELKTRWTQQRTLDDTIAAINAGRDDEAITLASNFRPRPAVFVGLLARMVQTHRPVLVSFVMGAIEHNPSLGSRQFGGRALIHYAAGAGCLALVTSLLRLGTDPNLKDAGGHTPLYRVANECGSPAGPQIAQALLEAGAEVNACAGVTRSTPLHMAARRGHVEIARVLIDCGADLNARDTKRDTPLQRAINCRKDAVAQLLRVIGAPPR